jgi:hypothetical protein
MEYIREGRYPKDLTMPTMYQRLIYNLLNSGIFRQNFISRKRTVDNLSSVSS